MEEPYRDPALEQFPSHWNAMLGQWIHFEDVNFHDIILK